MARARLALRGGLSFLSYVKAPAWSFVNTSESAYLNLKTGYYGYPRIQYMWLYETV
jgi:hypothetical protein